MRCLFAGRRKLAEHWLHLPISRMHSLDIDIDINAGTGHHTTLARSKMIAMEAREKRCQMHTLASTAYAMRYHPRVAQHRSRLNFLFVLEYLYEIDSPSTMH